MIRFWGQKINRFLSYGLLVICLMYVAGAVVYTYQALQDLSGRIEKELGNKAVLVAMSVAQNQSMNIQEFNRLADLDFIRLLDDSANISFENQARELMSESDIKYIYLEAPLPDDRVKYRVESGEEEIYGCPAGTPLNVIYLLDAVVDDETRMEDTDGQWYVDKDRYTVKDEQFQAAFESQKACYYINSDQWGTYITGYAPYVDGKGECLGLIGVDLFMDNYAATMFESRQLIIILLLSALLMSLLAIYLAVRLKYTENLAEEKAILARTDPLTELYNRRHFMEQIEADWKACAAHSQSLSLVMIDVDHLKEYNDNFGHLAGDRVLRHVAAAIAAVTTETGGVVGRYGGDEFVISMPGIGRKEALEAARNIGARVRQWSNEGEAENLGRYPTVSVGVACVIPGDGLRIEDLIGRADKVLYQAKGQGRNRVCG